MFTTRDRDNDVRLFGNCALDYKGAWWYEDCLHSNLNAQYLRSHHSSNYDGVNWGFWRENHYSLKKTEMKIRPRSFWNVNVHMFLMRYIEISTITWISLLLWWLEKYNTIMFFCKNYFLTLYNFSLGKLFWNISVFAICFQHRVRHVFLSSEDIMYAQLYNCRFKRYTLLLSPNYSYK